MACFSASRFSTTVTAATIAAVDTPFIFEIARFGSLRSSRSIQCLSCVHLAQVNTTLCGGCSPAHSSQWFTKSQRTTVTSGWGCSRRSQFCCSRTCRAGCAGGPTVLLEHPASLERQLGARQPAPPKLLDSARQCHGAARQPQPAHHGMRSVPRAARPLGSISTEGRERAVSRL